jgi:hypothetical protein
MSDDRQQDDEAFGERVARVLRRVERFDDTFETDLVAAIRADRAIEPRLAARVRPWAPAWWGTARTLHVSPIAGLAMAASLAAIVSLGTLGLTRSRVAARPATVAQAVHDTVNVVRFVFVGPAKTVSLVGDFNAWGARPVSLVPSGSNGAWTASVPLLSGRHEYAFIVDGQRWVADPFAPVSSDEFNTASSIITVGT